MQKRKLISALTGLLLAVILFAACRAGKPDSAGTGNPAGQRTEFLHDSKPVFSELGGFYTGELAVTVSEPPAFAGKNYTVRITYDGSEPTRRSEIYNGREIWLPGEHATETDFSGDGQNVKTTVLRAACFDGSGNLTGKIATAVFIQTQEENRFTLPVVALTTDPGNLTDSRTGIFTNWQQKGSAWERPVNVQFFEADGTLVLSQDAGIRLFGGSSRSLCQRSFRITARQSDWFETDRYDGAGKFKYALFEGKKDAAGADVNAYDSFILRNGGNDSLFTPTEPYRATFLRDGLAHKIAEKAAPEILNMNYRPVTVFLNGEYYGLLNLREHENDNTVRNLYGIDDKENICIIESEMDITRGTRYDGSWFYYKVDDGPESELSGFETLLREIQEGQYTFEEAAERIDTDNFMRYCAVNLFLCNTDWPHNNIKVWRYCGEPGDGLRDGKWRFVFKDMDIGMGRYTCGMQGDSPIELYTRADAKTFRFMLSSYLTFEDMESGFPRLLENRYPDTLRLQSLLAFFLQEESFRTEFTAYCRRLATEIWPPDALESLIRSAMQAVEPEMRNYLEKTFGSMPFDATTGYEEWQYAVTGADSLLSWARARSGENGAFLRELETMLEENGFAPGK